MFVKPNMNYRLLGSSLKVDKEQPYWATPARNQPNWRERKSIFIGENPGMLLHEGEYTPLSDEETEDWNEYVCAVVLTQEEFKTLQFCSGVGVDFRLLEFAVTDTYEASDGRTFYVVGFDNEDRSFDWHDELERDGGKSINSPMMTYGLLGKIMLLERRIL